MWLLLTMRCIHDGDVGARTPRTTLFGLGLLFVTVVSGAVVAARSATAPRPCHPRVVISGEDLDASARRTLACFASDLKGHRFARLVAREPSPYAGNPLPVPARVAGRTGFTIAVDPIGDAYSWRPFTVRLTSGPSWRGVLIGEQGTDSWRVVWGDPHGPQVPVSSPGD